MAITGRLLAMMAKSAAYFVNFAHVEVKIEKKTRNYLNHRPKGRLRADTEDTEKKAEWAAQAAESARAIVSIVTHGAGDQIGKERAGKVTKKDKRKSVTQRLNPKGRLRTDTKAQRESPTGRV
jgi:hypothetical protein